VTGGISATLRKYLSFERLFILICIAAFILRFAFLDLKLVHHDEAIHGWFSYVLLTKGTYVYDPSYHGPFLYYVTAGMFWLFGDTDLVARILPALFGALVIPLVYGIYKLGYLDRKQTLVAALFLAVSPDLVYFSRFLRHDIFQLFFTLLLVVALLWYINSGKTRYALVAGFAAGFGMTLKEDMPIFILIFAIFGLYLLIRKQIRLPVHWKRDLLIATSLSILIMLVIIPADITKGVYDTGWWKAVEHWTAMHATCRICGPWFFYIILFLLYEVPIFLLALFAVGQFGATDSRLRYWYRSIRERLSRKTPGTAELVQQSIRQIEGPPASTRQRNFFIFCLFWAAASIGAYAYIGEKVPWLIIHQLLPLTFVAVYAMSNRKAAIAVLSVAFLIVMTWHVSFVPADISEPIVQVQNSEDLRTVMTLMDASDIVMIASGDYWPLPWYYRGPRWDKIRFYGDIVNESDVYIVNPDMVITHDIESYPSLTGYDKKTYKLAYWFSYYDNQDRLLQYYFLRDGKLGSINIDVFTKTSRTWPPQTADRTISEDPTTRHGVTLNATPAIPAS
jgi:uncharacterized protein (TIGR03663 family)